MKVLDLRCDRDHGFEGWFASEDDYRAQCDAGLLACPLCGGKSVRRLPSAPRLNLGGSRAEIRPEAGADRGVAAVSASGSPPAPTPGAVDPQGVLLRAMRHVLAHTEDVGARFAEEARRIHRGQAEDRGIRGQATPDEAEALREEGIDVAVLAVPDALKETLQ